MKIYKPSKIPRKDNKIDLGYDRKDSKLLANETDYNVPVQILAKIKPEHIDKLDQNQFCSKCRAELILLEKTQKLLCRTCGSSIDLMHNTPLVQPDQSSRPYGSQFQDPNNLGDDRPFSVGLLIDDEPPEPDWEAQSSGDGRIQHIKLKKGVSPTTYRIKPEE